MNIQWYPGHMTKTRRQIEADLKNVDIVVEIIDARIPVSSRNPDIDAITAGKPRLVVLNRADQADPAGNRAWGAWFRKKGWSVLETDAKTGSGVNQFSRVVQEVLKDQIARWQEKGLVGRPVRAMVVGVPNVGKSTFINSFAGKACAKTGNKPGVTKGNQWIRLNKTLELLDTPGILWPRFEDQQVGLKLALIGSINDQILNKDELACELIRFLKKRYPQVLAERFGLETEGKEAAFILEEIARVRACLLKGGDLDVSRAAALLLDDFRAGKLGRITLEEPENQKDKVE